MKWKDLSLKERKQIYDTVRADNPNATYFDIKKEFDTIPEYEEGGKIKLPPENVPGTPEYFARQKRISGSVESVQPEAYITPAGYIKDAINFVSELSSGDYKDAAVSALMNVIPFGAGKVFKKIKNKTNVINGAVNELNSYAEPFAPTVTKKAKKSKVKKESDYDDEFNEVVRKSKNVSNYEKEISRSVEDAVFPDDETMNLINFVDNGYGTNYKRSYRDIAMRDMTNRGKYVKFEDLGPGHYGTMKGRKVEGDTYSINDFMIKLNPDYYLPGTANHELSHLADGLNNPYTKSVAGMRDTHYDNKYLDYLADYDNMYTVDELRKSGNSNLISSRNYLSDPTEVKAHMIGLKRALINSGNISRWSDKINKSMLDTYFDPRNASNYINEVSRNMYDLYRNKQGFVNRMNMLVPMEYAAPIGITGLAGYELNKE